MTSRLVAINPQSGGLPRELAPDTGAAYLTDESRLCGRAERLFFPRSEAELLAILPAAQAARAPMTVSGGRTGIAGGAVPEGGWLISMEAMNNIAGLRYDPKADCFQLRCQPGVTLEALHAAVERKSFPNESNWDADSQEALRRLRSGGAWLFPPDPTERSATLGGMAACNASGARTFHYGPTRRYITRLRLALADGAVLDLSRGVAAADPDGVFELELPNGVIRSGRIPDYRMPDVKSAAGYYARSGMDLLDLFIGAEGTLGVLTEMDILLIRAPEVILGVVAFFGSEADALAFVRAARGETPSAKLPQLASRPLALEYFDVNSLNLLREQKSLQGATSPIPALPVEAHTAVYIELAATEAELENAAESLLAMIEACGSRSDTAWTALTPEETERLKTFRHALPEAINQRIGQRARSCPGLTKLGTDLAVPDQFLTEMIALYRAQLGAAGLEYVMFGHIGNNHVHVNILPHDLDEYRKGKALYLELARQALAWGGTVSGEHGIGKIKKPLLRLMFGETGLAAMRAVKNVFDPDGRLNPGTMFDA